jgi:hypothetical protein
MFDITIDIWISARFAASRGDYVAAGMMAVASVVVGAAATIVLPITFPLYCVGMMLARGERP